jgi:DNA gyrase subunit A
MSDKTGRLASIAAVAEEDDILLITDEGTMIRTSVASIPVHSRTASGVIVMRLSEGAKIVTFARVEKEEEIVEESAEEGTASDDTLTATVAVDAQAPTNSVDTDGEDIPEENTEDGENS